MSAAQLALPLGAPTRPAAPGRLVAGAANGRTVRVGDLPWPGLYVLRSEIECRAYGHCEVLHVISAYAGGEIRGYRREAGSSDPFVLRFPAYPEFWAELDIATAALVGAPCNGFGGCGEVSR